MNYYIVDDDDDERKFIERFSKIICSKRFKNKKNYKQTDSKQTCLLTYRHELMQHTHLQ